MRTQTPNTMQNLRSHSAAAERTIERSKRVCRKTSTRWMTLSVICCTPAPGPAGPRYVHVIHPRSERGAIKPYHVPLLRPVLELVFLPHLVHRFAHARVPGDAHGGHVGRAREDQQRRLALRGMHRLWTSTICAYSNGRDGESDAP